MSAHSEFTHLDDQGKARMVNVKDKAETSRRAVATATVRMSSATSNAVAVGDIAKGDVLSVARIAGIQAAKKTADLIPLCHPLLISSVTVDLSVAERGVDIEAAVEIVGRTGVEMEALTACSVAALTVYDMCKALDKDMVISDIAVMEKIGGKSGPYKRSN